MSRALAGAACALLVACAASERGRVPASVPEAGPASAPRSPPPPPVRATGRPAHGDGKALYGDDGRVEVRDAPAPLRRAADSVAALFEARQLVAAGAGRWRLPGEVGATREGEARWCPDERFARQPRGARCTAFLIAPRRIATSAHCVRADNTDPYADGIACGDARFVFGYRTGADGRPGVEPDADRVYRCAAVLDGEGDRTGADWRVIELDRSVHGRPTLAVYAGDPLPVGTSLSAIGHPSGLPAKIATGARLVEHREAGYFVTDLDTYGGNSGSPVLARLGSEFAVVGVLSRGTEDFEEVVGDDGRTCRRSRQCEVGSCGGEHATLSDRLAEWPVRKVR